MKTLSLVITNPEPILKDLERLFAIESDSEFYYLSRLRISTNGQSVSDQTVREFDCRAIA